ncbi:MAG: CrcB family protein [Bdellovibrio sp.]|nr:MAG: CrcB family protein [Bdellovibrio sp.]
MKWIYIAILGGVGALCRYSIWLYCSKWEGFPYATLVVNALGSFLIGLLFAWAQKSSSLLSREAFLVVSMGFLGALTTFSSFSLDSLRLFNMGHVPLLLLNIFSNNFLSLFFCYLGFRLI